MIRSMKKLQKYTIQVVFYVDFNIFTWFLLSKALRYSAYPLPGFQVSLQSRAWHHLVLEKETVKIGGYKGR